MTGVMMVLANNVVPVQSESGPILYLDAEDYLGSGTTWTARTGPDATIANGTTYSASTPVYFSFDGNNGIAYTANLKTSFVNSNSRTLEIWVRTSADNGVVISEQGTSPINAGYHLSVMDIVSGSLKVGLWSEPSGIVSATVGSVTRDVWQHYVLTYDDATNTLTGYIDATTSASVSVENAPPSPQWYYALCQSDGTSIGDSTYLAADVGLFRVWNSALTAEQVQDLYDENQARFKLVTSNLVVSLDAGDINSYPGTGTTWTNLIDSTPYTISNGAYDSGNGGSIVFNGASTYVAIGTPLSNGTNFTKEAWVWADVVTLSRNILSSESNVLWNNLSTLSAGVGNQYSQVTSASFPTGVWRHVVQTFDDTANTMRLYINGVQVSQNTSVTQSYISQIERIGAHYAGGSPVSFWDGKISQVRVYDQALTGTQVLQNYNATKGRYGL